MSALPEQRRLLGHAPRGRLLVAAVLALSLLPGALLAVPAGAQDSPAVDATTTVANPMVQGPTSNGIRPNAWNASTFPLETPEYTYREDEYFISGTATYLEDMSTADYTSRYVIRQPVDAADFNGTVLVDWMNVTNGQDYEYNWWPTAYDYLMRQGYAIVAMSAQSTGVRHLRTWDPARYGSLNHPGDDYSFDIFAQAMKSVRDGQDNQPFEGEVIDPLLGREVQFLIGGGVSQSAGRLISFIDDGYTRGIVDAWNIERALGNTPENLETFVFILNEETNFAGGATAEQQPDSDGLRVWEEAGISHHAIEWWEYTFAIFQRDLAVPPVDPVDAGCSVNRGTNGYSVRAMLHHTQIYMEDGTLPPSAPRIPRLESGDIPRDEDTLAEGGLRHPFIEVPIAINRQADEDCINWGTYQPFSDERILELYATHEEYVRLTAEWGGKQTDAGLLLLEDCDDAIMRAYEFEGPWEALKVDPMPECPVTETSTTGPEIERVAGEDRVGTAIEAAQTSHPDGSPTAVIARADAFADALTGAPLARSLAAPLLLTEQFRLHPDVAGELERLGTTEVRVLGGPSAIDDAVVTALEEMDITVLRHGGDSRHATAAAIADALPAATGPAYVTSGDQFADALSVAPLAAHQGAPVLLARAASLPEETAAALESRQPSEVIIVGGPAVVGPEVEQAIRDLGYEVSRVEGANRYATTVAVNALAMDAGLTAATIWVADGNGFPDALAAGPAVAADGGLLLLVDGQDLGNSPETAGAFAELAPAAERIRLIGGEAAISPAVESDLRELLAEQPES